MLKCIRGAIVSHIAGFLILLHMRPGAQFSSRPKTPPKYPPGRSRTVNKMQTYQSRTFITKIKSFQA